MALYFVAIFLYSDISSVFCSQNISFKVNSKCNLILKLQRENKPCVVFRTWLSLQIQFGRSYFLFRSLHHLFSYENTFFLLCMDCREMSVSCPMPWLCVNKWLIKQTLKYCCLLIFNAKKNIRRANYTQWER